MAHAYKCDFCGEFFDISDVLPNKIRLVYPTGTFAGGWDLCPACLGKIWNVINFDNTFGRNSSEMKKAITPFIPTKCDTEK